MPHRRTPFTQPAATLAEQPTTRPVAHRNERVSELPVDVLERFHADIRRSLADLAQLVRGANGAGVDPNDVRDLLMFFEGPLLWHDEDEEVSVLARLRRTALEPNEEGLLERTSRGHDRMETLLESLCPMLTSMLAGEPLDVDEFHKQAHSLHNLLEAHMTLEERELFPLARKRLSLVEMGAIAEEIAARHGRHNRGRTKRAVALP